MDPRQVAVGTVGVGRGAVGQGRSRRVDDHEGDQDDCAGGRECRHEHRGVDAVLGGDDRHRDGCYPDAHWLRHLPDAHGEPAAVRREPAHDDPSARGCRARRGGAAEEQGDGERHQVGHEGCGEREDRGQSESEQEHQSLAAPVGDQAPRHQGEHHAERGCRGDDAGLGEGEALVADQGRDQERGAVDHHRRGSLRQRARDQHRPAPRGTDVDDRRGLRRRSHAPIERHG